MYGILFNNPAIFDGTALFHATHKNLVANGSKPSQASIQEIILQMQKQTDQFGDAIYINPEKIIVPVGYEFDLAVIFHSAQVTGSANNDINPLYNYPLHLGYLSRLGHQRKRLQRHRKEPWRGSLMREEEKYHGKSKVLAEWRTPRLCQ